MDDGSQKLVDNEFGEGKICNNGVKIASILDLFYDIIISSVWWSAEYGFFFPQNFLTCNDDNATQRPILFGLAGNKAI